MRPRNASEQAGDCGSLADQLAHCGLADENQFGGNPIAKMAAANVFLKFIYGSARYPSTPAQVT
jgi:hypothetical protein